MKRILNAALTAAMIVALAAPSVLAAPVLQDAAPITQEPAPAAPSQEPAPTPDPAAPADVAPAAPLPMPEVSVAGRVVMRVRSAAGGQSAEQRVSNLQQRIGPILILPQLRASDFVIRQGKPGETATIYVRDLILVTVDPELARTNNTSVEGLAERWVRNLRDVLPLVEVASVKATATAAQPPAPEPVPVTEPVPTAEPAPATEPTDPVVDPVPASPPPPAN